MFGFLSPQAGDLAYRSIYARCCQHLRQHHGLLALRFHSYEAAFLFSLAADVCPAIRAAIPARTCCGLRGIASWRKAPDRDVGRFCAALSMLLARIKLEDDIRDDDSWRARINRHWLQSAFRDADGFLTTLDAGFTARVGELLDRHLALERTREPMTLRDYAAPTADAFAYVFGLMAKLSPMESQFHLLTTVGRFVGTAVIASDCAADWHRDQRAGAMNPLASGDEVSLAWDLSHWAIQQAAATCERELGADAASGYILRAVQERIAARKQGVDLCPTDNEIIKALIRPSVRAKHVYLFSGCEMAVACCCCCVCCGAVAKSCDGDSKTIHVFHHRGCQ